VDMAGVRFSQTATGTTLAVLLFLSLFTAGCPSPAADGSYTVGASRITRDALSNHLEFLCSPEMEGRANGSEGATAAAEYIEQQFRSIGLSPGVADTGFVQSYTANTGVRVEGVIGMRDLARGYAFNIDYTPIGLSGDGKLITNLVFAGYGITAPEHRYDDYEGIDVRGKVVLVFLGEPGMKDSESRFDGLAPTPYSQLYRKALNAAGRGAAGILLSEGPLYAEPSDPAWKVARDIAHRNAGAMVCQVSRSAAQALVEPYGISLRDLQEEIDGTGQPRSIDFTESKVELVVEMGRQETQLANVVGRIPGAGSDALVLVAHYDGSGRGLDNAHQTTHPSANANATGIAALIEIARTLKRLPQPSRTVYFAAVSGEELGGLGVQALVNRGIESAGREVFAVSMNALGRSPSSQATLRFLGDEIGSETIALLEEVAAAVPDKVDLTTIEIPSLMGAVPGWPSTFDRTLCVDGGPDPRVGSPRDDLGSLESPTLVRNARYIYGVVLGLAN